MANRVHPTPIDADNFSGSLPAACSDWRISDADSMSARTTAESTLDAGYTTAGAPQKAKTSISLLHLWGSPYTNCYASLRLLGYEALHKHLHHLNLLRGVFTVFAMRGLIPYMRPRGNLFLGKLRVNLSSCELRV